MPSTHESNDIKKAMAYDIFRILEEENAKEARQYTMDDIKLLINNYISASTSNS